jgi:hypothetical protein
MSFLSSNDAEYLSARLTQRGRNAIARGNFNIQYFQIGDSEFNYNTPFTGLTGTTGQQKVLSPTDKENGVKYPYTLDSQKSTTYGNPIVNSTTTSIRNVMGTAGFVSNFNSFGLSTNTGITSNQGIFNETYTGTTAETVIGLMTFSELTGTNQITFTKNTEVNINPTGYTTLIFETFLTGYTIDNQNNKIIKNYLPTGNTNSFIYRYSGGTTGSTQTLTLDRNTPNLTGLTGNVQVVSNTYKNEDTTGDIFNPIDYTGQLNSWTLDTIWGIKPIGGDYAGTDESLTGYTGNQYISMMEYLGYSSQYQVFTNLTGGTVNTGFTSTLIGTSFVNSFNETIQVAPNEQRCVAVIHYSELGDITNDPQRFYKYDDYISSLTGTTGTSISLLEHLDHGSRDYNKSDSDYFEIYIPFIYYHRNTGTTLGALFTMDHTDYYIKPVSGTTGSRFHLKYRYLLDEQGVKVGKVFVDKKIVVFDDQELVAMLDYRSNRRYTLPSPKLGLTPSDGIIDHSIMTGITQTAWVTYMFGYTGDNKHHAHPCNYFNKITGTTVPSHIIMKFSGNSFNNMVTNLNGVTDGFIADKFYALVQVNTGQTPSPNSWKKIDITSQIPGYTSGPINPSGLTGNTFTIYMSGYTGTTNFFDLEDHFSGLTTNYLGDTDSTIQPQFGDEQPFPGSIRLVRASDIEEMNFLVNLPSSQFTTSQNPTYVSGDKKITEVTLLDSNKEPLVVAKTTIPITRVGTQVFAIKLDF